MTSSSAKIFIGNLPTEIREHEIKEMFEKFGKIRFVNLKLPPRPPPYAFLEFEDSRDADDACREMHHKEVQGHVIRVEIIRERRPNDDRGRDRNDDRGRDRRDDRSRDRRDDRGRDRSRDRGYDRRDDRRDDRGRDRYDDHRGRDRYDDRRDDRRGRDHRYEDRRQDDRRQNGRQNPGETPYRVRVKGLERDVSWQDLKDLMRKEGDVMHTEVDRRGSGLCHFSSREEMLNAIQKLDDTEYRGQRIRIEEDGGESSRRSRSRSAGKRRHPSVSRSRSGSPRGRRHSRSPSRSPRRSASRSRSPREKSKDRRSRSPSPKTSPLPKRTSEDTPMDE